MKLERYKKINRNKAVDPRRYIINLEKYYDSKLCYLDISNNNNFEYTLVLKPVEDRINKLANNILKIEEYEPFNGEEYFLKFSINEVYNSLKHEGVATTRRQTEIILNNKSDYEKSNDEIENLILNTDNGLRYIMNNEISINNLFNLYSIMTKNIKENLIEKDSFYRKKTVFLTSQTPAIDFAHEGYEASTVPGHIERLINFINKSKLDSEITAAVAHVVFERIHPYYDYNGRIGRLLHLWVLIQKGSLKKFAKYRFLSVSIYKYRRIFEKAFTDLDYSSKYKGDFDLTYWVGSIIEIMNYNLEDYYNYLTITNGLKISKNLKITILEILKDYRTNKDRWFERTYIEKLLLTSKTVSYRVLNEIRKLGIFDVIESTPLRFRLKIG